MQQKKQSKEKLEKQTSKRGDGDDVLVLEPAAGDRLVAESFDCDFVGRVLGVEELDRVVGAQCSVFGLVDGAHAAHAEALHELQVPEDPADEGTRTGRLTGEIRDLRVEVLRAGRCACVYRRLRVW